MRYIKYFPVVLLFICICCEDSIFYTKPTGTITGYVDLMYQSSFEGVKVTVDQVNKHAYSDSTGKWVIKNLPQGTYTFTFSKEGYGTYKYFGYNFVGGGDDYFSTHGNLAPVNIYKIPEYSIKDININIETYMPDFNVINISGNLSEYVEEGYKVIVFIGLSEEVSYESGYHIFSNCSYYIFSDSTYSIGIDVNNDLYQIGLEPGTDIYIRVYSGCYGGYHDPQKDDFIHTALNPNSSDVVKVVLP